MGCINQKNKTIKLDRQQAYITIWNPNINVQQEISTDRIPAVDQSHSKFQGSNPNNIFLNRSKKSHLKKATQILNINKDNQLKKKIETFKQYYLRINQFWQSHQKELDEIMLHIQQKTITLKFLLIKNEQLQMAPLDILFVNTNEGKSIIELILNKVDNYDIITQLLLDFNLLEAHLQQIAIPLFLKLKYLNTQIKVEKAIEFLKATQKTKCIEVILTSSQEQRKIKIIQNFTNIFSYIDQQNKWHLKFFKILCQVIKGVKTFEKKYEEYLQASAEFKLKNLIISKKIKKGHFQEQLKMHSTLGELQFNIFHQVAQNKKWDIFVQYSNSLIQNPNNAKLTPFMIFFQRAPVQIILDYIQQFPQQLAKGIEYSTPQGLNLLHCFCLNKNLPTKIDKTCQEILNLIKKSKDFKNLLLQPYQDQIPLVFYINSHKIVDQTILNFLSESLRKDFDFYRLDTLAQILGEQLKFRKIKQRKPIKELKRMKKQPFCQVQNELNIELSQELQEQYHLYYLHYIQLMKAVIKQKFSIQFSHLNEFFTFTSHFPHDLGTAHHSFLQIILQTQNDDFILQQLKTFKFINYLQAQKKELDKFKIQLPEDYSLDAQLLAKLIYLKQDIKDESSLLQKEIDQIILEQFRRDPKMLWAKIYGNSKSKQEGLTTTLYQLIKQLFDAVFVKEVLQICIYNNLQNPSFDVMKEFVFQELLLRNVTKQEVELRNFCDSFPRSIEFNETIKKMASNYTIKLYSWKLGIEKHQNQLQIGEFYLFIQHFKPKYIQNTIQQSNDKNQGGVNQQITFQFLQALLQSEITIPLINRIIILNPELFIPKIWWLTQDSVPNKALLKFISTQRIYPIYITQPNINQLSLLFDWQMSGIQFQVMKFPKKQYLFHDLSIKSQLICYQQINRLPFVIALAIDDQFNADLTRFLQTQEVQKTKEVISQIQLHQMLQNSAKKNIQLFMDYFNLDAYSIIQILSLNHFSTTKLFDYTPSEIQEVNKFNFNHQVQQLMKYNFKYSNQVCPIFIFENVNEKKIAKSKRKVTPYFVSVINYLDYESLNMIGKNLRIQIYERLSFQINLDLIHDEKVIEILIEDMIELKRKEFGVEKIAGIFTLTFTKSINKNKNIAEILCRYLTKEELQYSKIFSVNLLYQLSLISNEICIQYLNKLKIQNYQFLQVYYYALNNQNIELLNHLINYYYENRLSTTYVYTYVHLSHNVKNYHIALFKKYYLVFSVLQYQLFYNTIQLSSQTISKHIQMFILFGYVEQLKFLIQQPNIQKEIQQSYFYYVLAKKMCIENEFEVEVNRFPEHLNNQQLQVQLLFMRKFKRTFQQHCILSLSEQKCSFNFHSQNINYLETFEILKQLMSTSKEKTAELEAYDELYSSIIDPNPKQIKLKNELVKYFCQLFMRTKSINQYVKNRYERYISLFNANSKSIEIIFDFRKPKQFSLNMIQEIMIEYIQQILKKKNINLEIYEKLAEYIFKYQFTNQKLVECLNLGLQNYNLTKFNNTTYYYAQRQVNLLPKAYYNFSQNKHFINRYNIIKSIMNIDALSLDKMTPNQVLLSKGRIDHINLIKYSDANLMAALISNHFMTITKVLDISYNPKQLCLDYQLLHIILRFQNEKNIITFFEKYIYNYIKDIDKIMLCQDESILLSIVQKKQYQVFDIIIVQYLQKLINSKNLQQIVQQHLQMKVKQSQLMIYQLGICQKSYFIFDFLDGIIKANEIKQLVTTLDLNLAPMLFNQKQGDQKLNLFAKYYLNNLQILLIPTYRQELRPQKNQKRSYLKKKIKDKQIEQQIIDKDIELEDIKVDDIEDEEVEDEVKKDEVKNVEYKKQQDKQVQVLKKKDGILDKLKKAVKKVQIIGVWSQDKNKVKRTVQLDNFLDIEHACIYKLFGFNQMILKYLKNNFRFFSLFQSQPQDILQAIDTSKGHPKLLEYYLNSLPLTDLKANLDQIVRKCQQYYLIQNPIFYKSMLNFPEEFIKLLKPSDFNLEISLLLSVKLKQTQTLQKFIVNHLELQSSEVQNFRGIETLQQNYLFMMSLFLNNFSFPILKDGIQNINIELLLKCQKFIEQYFEKQQTKISNDGLDYILGLLKKEITIGNKAKFEKLLNSQQTGQIIILGIIWIQQIEELVRFFFSKLPKWGIFAKEIEISFDNVPISFINEHYVLPLQYNTDRFELDEILITDFIPVLKQLKYERVMEKETLRFQEFQEKWPQFNFKLLFKKIDFSQIPQYCFEHLDDFELNKDEQNCKPLVTEEISNKAQENKDNENQNDNNDKADSDDNGKVNSDDNDKAKNEDNKNNKIDNDNDQDNKKENDNYIDNEEDEDEDEDEVEDEDKVIEEDKKDNGKIKMKGMKLKMPGNKNPNPITNNRNKEKNQRQKSRYSKSIQKQIKIIPCGIYESIIFFKHLLEPLGDNQENYKISDLQVPHKNLDNDDKAVEQSTVIPKKEKGKNTVGKKQFKQNLKIVKAFLPMNKYKSRYTSEQTTIFIEFYHFNYPQSTDLFLQQLSRQEYLEQYNPKASLDFLIYKFKQYHDNLQELIKSEKYEKWTITIPYYIENEKFFFQEIQFTPYAIQFIFQKLLKFIHTVRSFSDFEIDSIQWRINSISVLQVLARGILNTYFADNLNIDIFTIIDFICQWKLLQMFLAQIIYRNIMSLPTITNLFSHIYVEFQEKPVSQYETQSDSNYFLDQIFQFQETEYQIYQKILIITLNVFIRKDKQLKKSIQYSKQFQRSQFNKSSIIKAAEIKFHLYNVINESDFFFDLFQPADLVGYLFNRLDIDTYTQLFSKKLGYFVNKDVSIIVNHTQLKQLYEEKIIEIKAITNRQIKVERQNQLQNELLRLKEFFMEKVSKSLFEQLKSQSFEQLFEVQLSILLQSIRQNNYLQQSTQQNYRRAIRSSKSKVLQKISKFSTYKIVSFQFGFQLTPTYFQQIAKPGDMCMVLFQQHGSMKLEPCQLISCQDSQLLYFYSLKDQTTALSVDDIDGKFRMNIQKGDQNDEAAKQQSPKKMNGSGKQGELLNLLFEDILSIIWVRSKWPIEQNFNNEILNILFIDQNGNILTCHEKKFQQKIAMIQQIENEQQKQQLLDNLFGQNLVSTYDKFALTQIIPIIPSQINYNFRFEDQQQSNHVQESNDIYITISNDDFKLEKLSIGNFNTACYFDSNQRLQKYIKTLNKFTQRIKEMSKIVIKIYFDDKLNKNPSFYLEQFFAHNNLFEIFELGFKEFCEEKQFPQIDNSLSYLFDVSSLTQVKERIFCQIVKQIEFHFELDQKDQNTQFSNGILKIYKFLDQKQPLKSDISFFISNLIVQYEKFGITSLIIKDEQYEIQLQDNDSTLRMNSLASQNNKEEQHDILYQQDDSPYLMNNIANTILLTKYLFQLMQIKQLLRNDKKLTFLLQENYQEKYLYQIQRQEKQIVISYNLLKDFSLDEFLLDYLNNCVYQGQIKYEKLSVDSHLLNCQILQNLMILKENQYYPQLKKEEKNLFISKDFSKLQVSEWRLEPKEQERGLLFFQCKGVFQAMITFKSQQKYIPLYQYFKQNINRQFFGQSFYFLVSGLNERIDLDTQLNAIQVKMQINKKNTKRSLNYYKRYINKLKVNTRLITTNIALVELIAQGVDSVKIRSTTPELLISSLSNQNYTNSIIIQFDPEKTMQQNQNKLCHIGILIESNKENEIYKPISFSQKKLVSLKEENRKIIDFLQKGIDQRPQIFKKSNLLQARYDLLDLQNNNTINTLTFNQISVASFCGQMRTDFIEFQDITSAQIACENALFVHSQYQQIQIFPKVYKETLGIKFKWQPIIKGIYNLFLGDQKIDGHFIVLANKVDYRRCEIILPEKIQTLTLYQTIKYIIKLRDHFNNIYGNIESKLNKMQPIVTTKSQFSESIVEINGPGKEGTITINIKFVQIDFIQHQPEDVTIKISLLDQLESECTFHLEGLTLEMRIIKFYQKLKFPQVFKELKIERVNFAKMVQKLADQQLKCPLKITYIRSGEQGSDDGGLRREFYNKVGELMKSQSNGFFRLNAKSQTYFFSPKFQPDKEKEQYAIAFGKLIANSILNKEIIGVPFAHQFWKLIFNKPIVFEDLEGIMDDVEFKNIKSLRQMTKEDIDSLCITFTHSQGTHIINLIPNGYKIQVTIHNTERYLQKLADYLIVGKFQAITQNIIEGFDTVLNRQLLMDCFDATEMHTLTVGSSEIKPEKVLELMIYINGSDQLIQFFQKFINQLEDEQLQDFLQFLTGSPYLPWNAKPTIQIEFLETMNETHLPRSQTCFYKLTLPYYKTYEDLKKKMEKAIEYGQEGFGSY
ncbi:unnamed protein product (macronuclear) [Paramecium tetraurelia]|uniref:HECT-type E3 ubiquitin transferase n=1 Tax=Paramecium tetraurelia TaxID=5888 RepID=A0DLU6_PARTE|nr:uncharacterized protein GSPATT00039645001 [Paramecium tetraurelia]CAK84013.1 unnamed protein product [Paramecium tetraurelia]|eukprot:XP_001451410.1 hypothetical protein (macronuclear) [Paramecium tetraurelia strain d4-2]